jgi:hypothetical protein
LNYQAASLVSEQLEDIRPDMVLHCMVRKGQQVVAHHLQEEVVPPVEFAVMGLFHRRSYIHLAFLHLDCLLVMEEPWVHYQVELGCHLIQPHPKKVVVEVKPVVRSP